MLAIAGTPRLIASLNAKDEVSVPYEQFTFISIMDNCGVHSQSVVLKRIVGHSNKDVTEHYTHKDIEQLLLAIDKYKLPATCDEFVTDNVI